ncbi:hypothetical protein CDAR_574891 [Caerostris darwini]|uniref:Uncharacterized protein n=1 Tax=Caerostris darwini TaxID=1538125 RepID=A0AAV4SY63_9ARAC|nr:hypothetical protein CDAR_574891 [Caerostris darwini]
MTLTGRCSFIPDQEMNKIELNPFVGSAEKKTRAPNSIPGIGVDNSLEWAIGCVIKSGHHPLTARCSIDLSWPQLKNYCWRTHNRGKKRKQQKQWLPRSPGVVDNRRNSTLRGNGGCFVLRGKFWKCCLLPGDSFVFVGPYFLLG